MSGKERNNLKVKSNFDKVKTLIETETGKNLQSVIVPLELIEYTGETQKAVFLARLIYLSDKGKKPNGFIWKSYPEWKDEIGFTQSQVQRIVADFVYDKKILIAKKMMAGSGNGNASNTWHYKLLMNKFLADFKRFLTVRGKERLQFQPEETDASITESTNINTTDIYTLSEENNYSYQTEEEEKEKVITKPLCTESAEV